MSLNNIVTKLETIEPHPTEAIVLYFNFDDIAFVDLNVLYEITKKNFPNNTVVCVPDKVSLESWSKDVLENYISMISEIIEEL